MSTVLCICTFRRPDGLRKLLLALPAVQGSEGLTIVVADNDAKAEGIAVCNEPVSYTHLTLPTKA